MTTTTAHPLVPPTAPAAAAALAPQRTARRLLRADAVLCALPGLALIAARGPVADLTGAPTGWLVAIGVFLAVLGLDLALIAAAPRRWLQLGARLTGAGDLAWVAASVVVALAADLTGAGRAIVLAQAVAVAAIGVAKLRLARRLHPIVAR